MSSLVPTSAEYLAFLEAIKERVKTAQVRAAVAANRELVLLYWGIGRDILARQAELGWGSKVIDRLSADLRRAFPDARGFSPRNLKYMRAFAEAWLDEEIVQEALAQITWYQNVTLLEKLNFYLSAVDDLKRDPDTDGPSIGLLLCRSKNRLVAEYALRDIHKPIGVADIQLTRLLPADLQGSLPTVETLEAELASLAEPDPSGREDNGADEPTES